MIRTLMTAAMLCAATAGAADAVELPKGFSYLRDVAPSIVQDMRYFGNHNFLGRPVAGYEANECILTTRAGLRLQKVQQRLEAKGLSLKVYDCYRPKQAVADFVAWARDPGDRRTKA
ncbi:MAG: M15 family metallopeptidase, partial [Aestuariivirgaceae bacterium]